MTNYLYLVLIIAIFVILPRVPSIIHGRIAASKRPRQLTRIERAEAKMDIIEAELKIVSRLSNAEEKIAELIDSTGADG